MSGWHAARRGTQLINELSSVRGNWESDSQDSGLLFVKSSSNRSIGRYFTFFIFCIRVLISATAECLTDHTMLLCDLLSILFLPAHSHSVGALSLSPSHFSPPLLAVLPFPSRSRSHQFADLSLRFPTFFPSPSRALPSTQHDEPFSQCASLYARPQMTFSISTFAIAGRAQHT